MRTPLAGPSVWSGEQMAQRTDWIEALEDAEVAELMHAVKQVADSGLSWLELNKAHFALPLLSRRLARVAHALEHGAGFVTLRNLPVEQLDATSAMVALWGIGLHLGTAVSQSRYGELLGEVRDYGEQLGQAGSRGYRTGVSLRFHTDRCDLVALLCVRQCRSGGESRIASTPFLHNQLLQQSPQALDLLFDDWFHSRQGEHAPGELRYYRNPIFASHSGRFTSQYSRSYIESAQQFPEVPGLTAAHIEALDQVIAAADRDCFETRMQPGDLQMLNNHLTWHARTTIDDFDAPQKKRMLYRLWLSSPLSRTLPTDFAELWGATHGGAVRGGVVSGEGYRTADELLALEREGKVSARSGWPLEALPA